MKASESREKNNKEGEKEEKDLLEKESLRSARTKDL